MSIESLMPSYHLVLCLPLFLLPSIFLSLGVFSNESAVHIRWSEYWSFSISPSNDYSGLISFRIDWFDIPAVKGTLKSLLQQHNLKASVPRRSAFFMVQSSHPHMTPGKAIALTIWSFVSRVMALLCNTLSRFAIAFLPRSNMYLYKHMLYTHNTYDVSQRLDSWWFRIWRIENKWTIGKWREFLQNIAEN